MTRFLALKAWAKELGRDVAALHLAARDPRVPWFAKAVAVAVAAYAVSPIDLIPDFIPVLGYLDELVILPLGIRLAVRLVPPEVMAEHRAAASSAARGPGGRAAAAALVAGWLAAAGALAWAVWPRAAPWGVGRRPFVLGMVRPGRKLPRAASRGGPTCPAPRPSRRSSTSPPTP